MTSIDTKASWNDRGVAANYARASSLMPAELAVFADAWAHLSDRRVLDLGVGGGRTLPFLHGPARHYIAVDYSEAMVEVCRARFPGVDVRQDDARDLAGIGDESIDFAFFSYNSIDCIPAEDRPSVYAAVRRVLPVGGMFGFSSHNARLVEHVPSKFKLPELEWTTSPVRLGARLARASVEAARSFKNHRRLRSGERRGDGYVVVNDGAHEFSMLFVYADPTWQVAELERAGFGDVRVYDQRGRRADHASIRDEWVHYLCTKR